MDSGRNDNDRSIAARAPAARLVAATLCALGFLALGGTASPALAGACANADATIDEASGDELRKAIVCLINDDRRDKGRHVLDSNGKLQSAAVKHNKAMKRENCWEHQCRGEPSLGKRVRNSGYLNGAKRWRYAQSFGCASTPRQMLGAWLDTDFNRENIRNTVFRDIGVGVLKDQVGRSECDTGNEVTYTVVFGRRRG